MTEEQLKIEALVERVIEHMKSDVGSVEFDKLEYLEDLSMKVRRRMMTKGLITQPFASKSDLKTLTEYGWSFTTFEQERKSKKEKEDLEKAQSQSIIDTNRSVRKTNLMTTVNIISTIIFSIVVIFIQIKSCNREKLKIKQEEDRLLLDSIKSSQQLLHDSLFQNKILHLLKEPNDSLRNR